MFQMETYFWLSKLISKLVTAGQIRNCPSDQSEAQSTEKEAAVQDKNMCLNMCTLEHHILDLPQRGPW